MIEKLLARIARRSPLPSPLSVIAPSNAAGGQGREAQLSSTGAHDPFSSPYPASRRVRSARSGSTQPGSVNAWLIACDDYVQRRHAGAPIADQPAYFAHWGVAHMSVAHLLWAQHEQLGSGEVQIRSGGVLVAALAPSKRMVLLDAAAYQPSAPLALHVLPAGQSSPELLGKEFVSHSLYSLLWFYGQVYSAAPDLLPPEMGVHLIQLRRFPQVEPAALEMRHLALIHVFSGGALSFAQLQNQISADHAHNLCADLASLHFTGALRLLP